MRRDFKDLKESLRVQPSSDGGAAQWAALKHYPIFSIIVIAVWGAAFWCLVADGVSIIWALILFLVAFFLFYVLVSMGADIATGRVLPPEKSNSDSKLGANYINIGDSFAFSISNKKFVIKNQTYDFSEIQEIYVDNQTQIGGDGMLNYNILVSVASKTSPVSAHVSCGKEYMRSCLQALIAMTESTIPVSSNENYILIPFVKQSIRYESALTPENKSGLFGNEYIDVCDELIFAKTMQLVFVNFQPYNLEGTNIQITDNDKDASYSIHHHYTIKISFDESDDTAQLEVIQKVADFNTVIEKIVNEFGDVVNIQR